jgi:hypothetical protein
MPYLMQVPALEGKGLVPGYRTLNVLGITPGRRGILYHRLFSSQAPGFVSEPAEVQEALETVSQVPTPLKANKTVTWITTGALMIWRFGVRSGNSRSTSSAASITRSAAFEDQQGRWMQGNLAQAQQQMRTLARVTTTLEVQRGQQRHPKRQPVKVDIAACPVRLTYSTGVR